MFEWENVSPLIADQNVHFNISLSVSESYCLSIGRSANQSVASCDACRSVDRLNTWGFFGIFRLFFHAGSCITAHAKWPKKASATLYIDAISWLFFHSLPNSRAYDPKGKTTDSRLLMQQCIILRHSSVEKLICILQWLRFFRRIDVWYSYPRFYITNFNHVLFL